MLTFNKAVCLLVSFPVVNRCESSVGPIGTYDVPYQHVNSEINKVNASVISKEEHHFASLLHKHSSLLLAFWLLCTIS